MSEYLSKCYRVQEELLIPGVKPPVTRFRNQEKKNDFYLIVESATERYITQHGAYQMRKTDIMTDEYFPLQKLAEEEAFRRHKLACGLKSCGWTPEPEK
jgi:hypothetical protein